MVTNHHFLRSIPLPLLLVEPAQLSRPLSSFLPSLDSSLVEILDAARSATSTPSGP